MHLISFILLICSSEINKLYDCKTEGDEVEGGNFEVCSVKSPWLVGNPDHKIVRDERCVTTEKFELEPWYFAFSKNKRDCDC